MKKLLLAAIGLLLVLLFMRPPPAAPPARADRLVMGTLVTVKLYQEEAVARPLMETAFAEIERIDALMSRQRPESEANRLGSLAADSAVTCSAEMAHLLRRSQHFAYRTDGAFDVTVGALTRLWNFPEVKRPPAAARVDSALALVGYRDLQVEESRVRLIRPGLSLDLGGVAKGFAVDQAIERLQKLGAPCGLIEAGGDIRYWGEKPDGRAWRFGIQHPRQPERYIEIEDLGLAAIATSGDYEQFFEYEGKRYHHILDPASGYPGDRAVSATAWAHTAMDADILSTALFILGPEKGIDWIESLPAAEGLVFFADAESLRHRASSGVADRFHFMETDN